MRGNPFIISAFLISLFWQIEGNDFNLKDIQNQISKMSNSLTGDAKDILDKLKNTGLENVNVDDIWSKFNSSEFDKLISDSEIPPRLKRQLENIKAMNLKPKEAAAEIIKQGNSMTKRFNLMKSLCGPKNWTREVVKELKDVIFYCPLGQLMKIENTQGLDELLQYMRFCLDEFDVASDSKSCDVLRKPKNQQPLQTQGIGKGLNRAEERRQKSICEFLDKMIPKAYKDPNLYSEDLVKKIGVDIFTRCPSLLEGLKPAVVYNLADEFKVDCNSTPEAAANVIEKMLEFRNVSRKRTSTDVMNDIEKLPANLKNCVDPDMIPNVPVEGTPLERVFSQSRKERARQGLLKNSELKSLSKTLNRNFTKDAVEQLGSSFTKVASCGTISQAIDNGFIKIEQAIGQMAGKASKKDQSCLRKICQMLSSKANFKPVDVFEECTGTIEVSKIQAMSSSEKLKMAQKPLNKAQIAVLLKGQGATFVKDLNPKVKSAIPPIQLTVATDTQLKDIVKGLPSDSVPVMYAVQKLTSSMSTLKPDNFDEVLAEHAGVSLVDKIPSADVQSVLTKIGMSGKQPLQETCTALKDKWKMEEAKTDEDIDEEEMAENLTGEDIEDNVPCVIAALGPKALSKLDADARMVLLSKINEMENPLSVPKGIRAALVDQILMDKDRGSEGLTTEDLEDFDVSVQDIPSKMIRDTKDLMILELYLDQMNDIAMSRNGLCLDVDQVKEVGSALKRTLGDLSKVESSRLQNRCCLLFCLDRADINRISKEAIADCSCQTDFFTESYQKILDVSCKADTNIGDDVDLRRRYIENVQSRANYDILQEAQSARRKRQTTTTSLCEKIESLTVAALTQAELDSLTDAEVKSCLDAIGRDEIPSTHLPKLVSKVKSFSSNLATLTTEEVMQLQHLLKGFSVLDLAKFPKINNIDAVTAVGNHYKLSKEQKMELAKNIKANYKAMSAMLAEDLVAMNENVCGLTANDIDTITMPVFREAIGTLGNLKACDADSLSNLAKRAKSIFGPIKDYTRSDIAEMGRILNGFVPEDIQLLSKDACSGIRVETMEQMPEHVLKTFSQEQLEYLPAASFKALSPTQLSFMTEDQKKAFVNLGYEENGVSGLSPTYGLSLLLTLWMMHLV